MRVLIALVWLIISVVFSGCVSQSAQETVKRKEPAAPANDTKQPVLVELFTSEGCSSCPPADKVLAFLDREQPAPNANVITLGFHVDYWDSRSWRDRFSSAEFTLRQEAYARQLMLRSTYTPQMVVDGASEFVGSNGGAAVSAIAKSASQPKGQLAVVRDGNLIKIKVEGLGEHSDATIFLAVTESKLSSNVGGGENSGSKLEHASVVRQLINIGTITVTQTAAAAEHVIPTDAAWKRENLRYVAFVQENSTLKVLAAGQTAP